MKIRIPIYKKTYAFLAGMLCVAGLPPYYVLMAPIVGFCSLMLILNGAKSKKEAFAAGYWFGFGFFSFGLSWIGNAVLIEPERTGWLFPIILLSSGGFFGLFAAFPAMFTWFAKSIWRKIFVFAAMWTVFEWIRGFFLSGFPWNPVGSMFAFCSQLIQSAAIIGTFGLSFVAVLFFCLPAAGIIKRGKQAAEALILMALVFFVNAEYGVLRLKYADNGNSDTKIRIVQPAIPQVLKWEKSALGENFAQYAAMSAQSGIDDIDFVIWGETASPYNPRFMPLYLQKFVTAVPNDGYLLFGAVDYEFVDGDYRPKNSMLVMNKDGDIVDSYDKSHLVPFGEYIPFRKYLPDFVQPVAKIIGDFKAGDAHKVISLKDKPSLGALICYEVIFPADVVDENNRPQWIAVLTNDGWYGDSMGPYQHLVSAQMRAIEEGLPIVRSANSGISAIIDAYGQITEQLGLQKRGVVDGLLPKPLSRPTIYSKIHNLPIAALCLLIAAISIFFKRKNKQK